MLTEAQVVVTEAEMWDDGGNDGAGGGGVEVPAGTMEVEVLVEVMLPVVEMEVMVRMVAMETNMVILSLKGWD